MPVLNNELLTLVCYNNALKTLPTLDMNSHLSYIDFRNNEVYDIIGFYSVHEIHVTNMLKNKILQLNRFRHFFFSLRLKKRFISWLWKSREKRIREAFHYKHLLKFLEENENESEALDKFLNDWTSF